MKNLCNNNNVVMITLGFDSAADHRCEHYNNQFFITLGHLNCLFLDNYNLPLIFQQEKPLLP